MRTPKPGWYLWLPPNKSFFLFKHVSICLTSEGGLPLLSVGLYMLDLTTDKRKEKKNMPRRGRRFVSLMYQNTTNSRTWWAKCLEHLCSVRCPRVLVSHRNHSTPAKCARRSVGSAKLVIRSVRGVVGSQLYINANVNVRLWTLRSC